MERRTGGSRDTAHLWTLREGKAVRLEFYWDRAQALRAAGLAGVALVGETG